MRGGGGRAISRFVDGSVVESLPPAANGKTVTRAHARASRGSARAYSPVAEVAANHEKILGIAKKWRERCCAILQHLPPQISHHNRHERYSRVKQGGDEREVKLEGVLATVDGG